MKNLIDADKKVTENMLIEEHWKYWLSIDDKDHIKKLFNHPLLEDEDLSILNESINKNKMN